MAEWYPKRRFGDLPDEMALILGGNMARIMGIDGS